MAGDAEPTGTPAAELRYEYNCGDQRTLKRAIDAAGAARHTVYSLGSLELRHVEYKDADYAIGPYTAVPYLFAHGVRIARLAWEDSDVPSIPMLTSPQLHVFFELGDHLGSSSTVLDKDTSELVEKSTYLPYGGAESDYRPARWKGFREDHRFTGKEGDEEVGLTYVGFRYLLPAIGRWLSADPLSVHDADASPLYGYVRGRLLSASDPLGLWDWVVIAAGDPSGVLPESVGKPLRDWRDNLHREHPFEYDRAVGRVEGFVGFNLPWLSDKRKTPSYVAGVEGGQQLRAGAEAHGHGRNERWFGSSTRASWNADTKAHVPCTACVHAGGPLGVQSRQDGGEAAERRATEVRNALTASRGIPGAASRPRPRKGGKSHR
ncbi:MAG: RHS repeat-associated core domain-containing protein [Myxococcales bacterium]|nr:RHS repeat-associated core domain-containing protein [Myxococcales bacterium]